MQNVDISQGLGLNALKVSLAIYSDFMRALEKILDVAWHDRCGHVRLTNCLGS